NQSKRDLGPNGQVIVQVLAGSLSASDAAIKLGMSRQAINRWLNRAADGIKTALTPKKPGPAPMQPISPELAAAQHEIKKLRQKIASLEAIQLLLLALLKAAGMLP